MSPMRLQGYLRVNIRRLLRGLKDDTPLAQMSYLPVISAIVTCERQAIVSCEFKCANINACFLIQSSRMSHRKRKHRQRSDTYSDQHDQPASPSSARPDPNLFIVAHEADIIRGPQAARTADSLEVGINVDGKGGSCIGDGLIKWESGEGADAEGGGMWVDRCVCLSRYHLE